MNKHLRKLLAAALLLACLPVGVQGTESSRETVSRETGLSEGALVDVSFSQEHQGMPLQAGESWRMTNADGQTLVVTDDGQSGDMPWRWLSYPGSYGIDYGVEDSESYRLELDVQWTEGREGHMSVLQYAVASCWIKGSGFTGMEFTSEAVIITGQNMTYEAVWGWAGEMGRDHEYVCVAGSGEEEIRFVPLSDGTVRVSTKSAPSSVRLGTAVTAENVPLKLGEAALVRTKIGEFDIAVVPAEQSPGAEAASEPPSKLGAWFLAGAIGAIVVLAAVLVLWRLRRQKRPAPPEPAPERPPEADSPDSGGS